ncbi:MAG: class II fructose-bisphosphate aldolase [Pseudomonadota bacterium]
MQLLTNSDLEQGAGGVIDISDETVKVRDEKKLKDELIDRLVETAVFGEPGAALKSKWIIRMAAEELGVVPCSIQGLYDAMGRGEAAGFTVPAINLRTLTYDMARAVYRAAMNIEAGAFIFEIARSEIGYSEQPPLEFANVVLAAGIKEGFKGPVFIQGDHFQVAVKKYEADPEKELKTIENLITEAVGAGFYNIDIDASTLVDLSKPDLSEQQRLNFELTARFIRLIRKLEPGNITVSIGAEIGEVGGQNSTPEEFKAFMDGLIDCLKKDGDVRNISKISVQTGTSHGGVPLADGSVAEVKLDFEVLRRIGEVARSDYGLCGSVQHGASTLPEELFDKFPASGAGEIHLATGFQNIFYEHEAVPRSLKDEIFDYIKTHHVSEKKEGQTEAQFLYKLRKKGLGPFKRKIWELPPDSREKIRASLLGKFSLLMGKLNIAGTREVVKKHVNVAPSAPSLAAFRKGTGMDMKEATDVEGE